MTWLLFFVGFLFGGIFILSVLYWALDDHKIYTAEDLKRICDEANKALAKRPPL